MFQNRKTQAAPVRMPVVGENGQLFDSDDPAYNPGIGDMEGSAFSYAFNQPSNQDDVQQLQPRKQGLSRIVTPVQVINNGAWADFDENGNSYGFDGNGKYVMDAPTADVLETAAKSAWNGFSKDTGDLALAGMNYLMGADYDRSVARQRGRTKKLDKAYPNVSLGGRVAGNLGRVGLEIAANPYGALAVPAIETGLNGVAAGIKEHGPLEKKVTAAKKVWADEIAALLAPRFKAR